jgi:NitT/TauT family transport system substrate-binding protein
MDHRFRPARRDALLATLALLCLPRGGAAAEPQKVTIATAGVATMYSLPLVIAVRKGFFQNEGLDVELVDFGGGSKVLEAVVGGTVDIAAGGFDHVLTMHAKGMDLRAFVQFMRYPAMTIGITQKMQASYRSPADLKGKVVGVSAPGSSTHGLVIAFLEKNGLKPTDVSIVGLGGPSTAVAAVQGDRVDALCYVDPVMTMLESKKLVRIIADTRGGADTRELLGGEWPTAVIYASHAYIEGHPQVIQAVTSAMAHTLDWLQHATPEQVADAMPPRYVGDNRALYLQAYSKFREAIAPPQLMSESSARNGLAAAAMLNPAVKAAHIDLASTFDNRFMRNALKK